MRVSGLSGLRRLEHPWVFQPLAEPTLVCVQEPEASSDLLCNFQGRAEAHGFSLPGQGPPTARAAYAARSEVITIDLETYH